MLNPSGGPVGEEQGRPATNKGETVRELIGCVCGVIAALAAICLAYGITAWRFGDCPGWECEN